MTNAKIQDVCVSRLKKIDDKSLDLEVNDASN